MPISPSRLLTQDGKPEAYPLPVAEQWRQVVPKWYMAKKASHYLYYPLPPATQHLITGIALCRQTTQGQPLQIPN